MSAGPVRTRSHSDRSRRVAINTFADTQTTGTQSFSSDTPQLLFWRCSLKFEKSWHTASSQSHNLVNSTHPDTIQTHNSDLQCWKLTVYVPVFSTCPAFKYRVESFLAFGLICHIFSSVLFFVFLIFCLQVWQSGHPGSTSTTLEATETTSAWRRSVSITGRGFAHGPWPWRLALRTGWQQPTLGRWSTPVWKRASGALTRNSPTAASAQTTTSAFSVLQVALLTRSLATRRNHLL